MKYYNFLSIELLKNNVQRQGNLMVEIIKWSIKIIGYKYNLKSINFLAFILDLSKMLFK